MSLLGLPYKWGGDDPIRGFDCSGLVIELLQSSGVLPHGFDATADNLWKRPDFVAQEGARFGHLVYFGKDKATHVAFCLNEKLMLEAGGGGSKTNTAEDAASQNAYIRVRPVAIRKDILGYNRPPYPWKEGI